jgi:hypothetical protein
MKYVNKKQIHSRPVSIRILEPRKLQGVIGGSVRITGIDGPVHEAVGTNHDGPVHEAGGTHYDFDVY